MMKNIFFLFLLGLGLIKGNLLMAQQQSTPTATDTTTIRFIVKINVSSANYISATGKYRIISTAGVEDPVVKDTPFDNNSIQVGMFFVDVSGSIYQIDAIENRNPLTFQIKGFNGSLANTTINTGIGVIYTPTPNLLLPQWVTTMPQTVLTVLLSHLANMIDLKLGKVSTPSIQIKTANYQLASGDDTVLFNLTNGEATLTLPTPSASNNGRTYKIGKVDNSSNILNITPQVQFLAGTTVGAVNYPRTFIIQSDGTRWWVVNQN